MSSSPPIDCYFDLASPYCYLAIQALPPLAQRLGRTVAWHPVQLADLKRAIGNHGADLRAVPAKHRYVLADCDRWARELGVPFVDPGPFDTLLLHRAVFYASDRGQAQEYLLFMARQLWAQGRTDVDEVLAQAAGALGWSAPGLAAWVRSAEAQRRQAQALEHAHAAGAFGVPTLVADGRLWWGQDRLAQLEAHLAHTGVAA